MSSPFYRRIHTTTKQNQPNGNFAGEECFCRDWHGCIMSQTIVGLDNVQPYKFSECSKKDYIDALRIGQGLCLLNKPNQVCDHFIFCLYFYYRFIFIGDNTIYFILFI